MRLFPWHALAPACVACLSVAFCIVVWCHAGFHHNGFLAWRGYQSSGKRKNAARVLFGLALGQGACGKPPSKRFLTPSAGGLPWHPSAHLAAPARPGATFLRLSAAGRSWIGWNMASAFCGAFCAIRACQLLPLGSSPCYRHICSPPMNEVKKTPFQPLGEICLPAAFFHLLRSPHARNSRAFAMRPASSRESQLL